MRNSRPISEDEARASGLDPITIGYAKSEQWMLENVIDDMERGNIEHAVVMSNGLPEVWRKKSADLIY